MGEPTSYHMTAEAFRRRGREVVDWVAGYLEHVEERPVLAAVAPGAVRAGLPEHAPEHPEPFEAVMADLERVILPGITHWQSPNFFAFYPANNSGPSILGELLSAGLGVQGMLWATSPACTELETAVLDWLVGMLGLPESFHSRTAGGGVIQDTASSATLCALLAARERATAGASNEHGIRQRLVAYGSTQAHSSLEKSCMIAGLGRDNTRHVATDEHHRMRPDALAEAIRRDREAGALPCFCCATVGTTSSGAVDPLGPIGEVCRAEGLWLHVDAAMAGTAAVCPELRFIHDGIEHADSYCFNPHKWMFTNFDCDCFWVSDRAALISALNVQREYYRTAAGPGEVFDYRDWHIPLGRRFRSLKLWMVIRHYGVEGLRHHVREHVALAQELAGWIASDPRFELVGEPPLNLVCFRHTGGDAANETLRDRLNASGKLYLSHTSLDGRITLRFSIGQTRTRRRHVEAAWRLIQATAATLC